MKKNIQIAALLSSLFFLSGCGSSIESDHGYYFDNIEATYSDCKDETITNISQNGIDTYETNCWDNNTTIKKFLTKDDIEKLSNVQKDLMNVWEFGAEHQWYMLPYIDDEYADEKKRYRGNCGPFHIKAAAEMTKVVPKNLIRLIVGNWGVEGEWGGAHLWTEVLSESGWKIINYGDIYDLNESTFKRTDNYYTELPLLKVMH